MQKADLQPADGASPDHIALGETVIRINGQQFWLYAAVNPDTNKFLHFRLFTTTTTALTRRYLQELQQKYDVSDAVFLVDHAKHLAAALRRAGLRFQTMRHGNRNAAERVFREVKRRTSSLSNSFSYAQPTTTETWLQAFVVWCNSLNYTRWSDWNKALPNGFPPILSSTITLQTKSMRSMPTSVLGSARQQHSSHGTPRCSTSKSTNALLRRYCSEYTGKRSILLGEQRRTSTPQRAPFVLLRIGTSSTHYRTRCSSPKRLMGSETRFQSESERLVSRFLHRTDHRTRHPSSGGRLSPLVREYQYDCCVRHRCRPDTPERPDKRFASSHRRSSR